MTKSSRILLFSTAVLILGIAGPASTLAKGPPIKVEQAVPNFAIQADMRVPMTLKGRNFPAKARVIFILNKAGDPNDGSKEQVVVSSDVILNPATGNLEFEIDVAAVATLGDYDIEVIELSAGGRKGKGTTLFSVTAKLSRQIPKFCVTIDAVATPTAILSDGHGEYCSSNTDKVSIGGGDRGFRFDTDSGGKENDARFVMITFSPYDPRFHSDLGDNFDSGRYEIDFRFVRESVNGQQGLSLIDLCVDCTGTVGISISFFAKSTKPKERGRLGYGELEDFEMDNLLAGDLDGHSVEDCFDPDLDDATPFVPGFNAKVTRTSPTTWTIESIPDESGFHPACVFEKTKNDSLVADSLKNGLLMDMPFNFTLRSLP